MKKNDIKIVFFGTPDFAVTSLDAIIKAGYNVVSVVTATDKVAGRGHKMTCSAVKQYALEHNLPLLQPEKLKNEDFIEALKSLHANLFVVIAFRMLPEAVWTLPKYGTFNLHASLLPKYRGAAPINHAIINGETKSGVTTFFLQHEIDTGDIIYSEEVDILPSDNAGTLHDKLMEIGARLTVKTIDDLVAEKLQPKPQQLYANITEEKLPTAPKIFKEDCRIDWDQSAEKIHNKVRGLSPVPGAWSELVTDKDEANSVSEIKIFETCLTDIPSSDTPGTLVKDGKHLYVNTSSNLIELKQIQPSGKKRMDASAFLNGTRNIENSLLK